MNRPPPSYSGYRSAGGLSFDAAGGGLQTGFATQDIKLDVAGQQDFPYAGDILYIDLDPLSSNGFATVQFNTKQDAGVAKFFLLPGMVLETTFKSLRFSWLPQPGKQLRFFYATGDRVRGTAGTVQGLFQGGLGVQPPQLPTIDMGVPISNVFFSTAPLAAVTAQNIFTAAANLASATVWDASLFDQAAAGNNATMLSKATAPASVGDGLVMLDYMYPAAAAVTDPVRLIRSLRVGAGTGLWFISSLAETLGQRRAIYSLW